MTTQLNQNGTWEAPESETRVLHQTINGKYRIVFEQAASTKGVIGFKVEVNGDLIDIVKAESEELLKWAQSRTPKQEETNARS